MLKAGRKQCVDSFFCCLRHNKVNEHLKNEPNPQNSERETTD